MILKITLWLSYNKTKQTTLYQLQRLFQIVVGKWGFWDIDLGNFRKLGQDFLYLF